MMKLVLGKWTADRVATGAAPERAAEEAITYLKTRLGGHGGLIVLDRQGRFGITHNTPHMAWGVRSNSRQDCGFKMERN
jgi:beta-aspartyl-peptidase (threonine type)